MKEFINFLTWQDYYDLTNEQVHKSFDFTFYLRVVVSRDPFFWGGCRAKIYRHKLILLWIYRRRCYDCKPTVTPLNCDEFYNSLYDDWKWSNSWANGHAWLRLITALASWKIWVLLPSTTMTGFKNPAKAVSIAFQERLSLLILLLLGISTKFLVMPFQSVCNDIRRVEPGQKPVEVT